MFTMPLPRTQRDYCRLGAHLWAHVMVVGQGERVECAACGAAR